MAFFQEFYMIFPLQGHLGPYRWNQVHKPFGKRAFLRESGAQTVHLIPQKLALVKSISQKKAYRGGIVRTIPG
jgi:hypothetical protein